MPSTSLVPATPPGFYSPHFSRQEMLVSQTAARLGIDNTPGPQQEANLARLCVGFLEIVRTHFGPLHISSGYRCPLLNQAAGGSKTSAHMDGRAVDFMPLSMQYSFRDVVDCLRHSLLPFDQVIFEYGSWVHLGIAAPLASPRRQVLMVFKGTPYLAYDASDARVQVVRTA